MGKKGHLTFEKGHLIFVGGCVRIPRTSSDTPLSIHTNIRVCLTLTNIHVYMTLDICIIRPWIFLVFLLLSLCMYLFAGETNILRLVP